MQVEPLNVSPLSHRKVAAAVVAVTIGEVFELYALEAVTVIRYWVFAVSPVSAHGELVQLADVVGGDAVPYFTL